MSLLRYIYHYFLALGGALLYRFPSREIFVLGVTGTKGKSSTLEFIGTILEQAGYKTAISNSVRFKIADESSENATGNTMPGRFFIQKFLRRAVKAGCRYALIEVTSQGVIQDRHKFIDFDAAMFLNLRPEHIEAHGSFENYRQAKLDFFHYVAKTAGERFWTSGKDKTFFINADDDNFRYFRDAAEDAGRIVSFSSESIKNGEYKIQGEAKLANFYKENIAAAASFAHSQGVAHSVIREALASFPGISGRMEIAQRKPFAVVIDYAHTPDSLRKVYSFLREDFGAKKLICLLGSAGGGRDKWKRPEMGKIAAEFCDDIVLADEDPYNDDPVQILSEIKSGILSGQNRRNLYEIINRKEAIKKALSLARQGDVVVLTGKGSEKSIHIKNGRSIPWNERMVVDQILGEK